jgi:ribonuclease E
VWLPSGGSLIIEHTEALTVIDVNTGKNVGSSSLEETVFKNNLEAAEEIARQLRLRDIGGIIVIDFIDMEIKKNREEVLRTFKDALARDKTRTQVFDISELGLVEMTRKRISEGLVEAFSTTCPACEGRGIVLDETLL